MISNPAIDRVTGWNAIINGNFTINQRGYASGGSIASGAFAHDRWKDFAGGSSYTFTQAGADTTITITSGTLMQPVDGSNVCATTMWLTWVGTAQAFVRQNGSNLAGISSGTPMTIGGVTVNSLLVTNIAPGVALQVAFQGGSLGLVQLEAAIPGAGPTRFERRHGGQELALCQRYYEVIAYTIFSGNVTSGLYYVSVPMKVTKRATPTITVTNVVNTNFSSSPSVTASSVGTDSFAVQNQVTGSGNGLFVVSSIASAEL